MKKNILSVVAVGLALSTVAGLMAPQAAEAGCNNNNRNQARQIRRMMQRQAMLQQQARLNQFNNPYFTQVNPGLYNNFTNPYYSAGYNPYLYNNNNFNNLNPYMYNNGGLLGNGLIGNGLQRVIGTLF